MNFLLIDGWQPIWFPASAFLLGLAGYFLWRSWKASKSGSKQQAHPGSPGVKQFKENIPIHKVASFKLFVFAFLAWVGMSIWVFSDYSSKVSKKIPQQQTDSTRQAAEDIGK